MVLIVIYFSRILMIVFGLELCFFPKLHSILAYTLSNIKIMWLQRLHMRIGEFFWKEEKDEGINPRQKR